MGARGRHRHWCSCPSAGDRALSKVQFPRRGRFSESRPLRDAVGIWRPRGEAVMREPSDALVIFGITGDLAYKKIFPALQALVHRGRLTVPVIGVARVGTLEGLIDRARS